MFPAAEKKCTRCGDPFQCRADAIELCHCSSVKLSEEELFILKDNYTDCLCANCLGKLKEEMQHHYR